MVSLTNSGKSMEMSTLSSSTSKKSSDEIHKTFTIQNKKGTWLTAHNKFNKHKKPYCQIILESSDNIDNTIPHWFHSNHLLSACLHPHKPLFAACFKRGQHNALTSIYAFGECSIALLRDTPSPRLYSLSFDKDKDYTLHGITATHENIYLSLENMTEDATEKVVDTFLY